MTIQVINDVVALQHSSSSDQWTIKEEDSYLRFRKTTCEDDDDYTTSTVSLSSKDSDDDSVVSTSSSTVALTNRVSFSEKLITMEWTRPYTDPDDVPLLYYSTEETNRYVYKVIKYRYTATKTVDLGYDFNWVRFDVKGKIPFCVKFSTLSTYLYGMVILHDFFSFHFIGVITQTVANSSLFRFSPCTVSQGIMQSYSNDEGLLIS